MAGWRDVRDHLFEVVDGLLHICAVGDIVLNLLILDSIIVKVKGLGTRSIKGATGIPRGFAKRMLETCTYNEDVGECTLGTAARELAMVLGISAVLTSRLWLRQPLRLKLYASMLVALLAFVQGFASRRKCPAMSALGIIAPSIPHPPPLLATGLSAPPQPSFSSSAHRPT
jgi:hypothetical protein